MFRILFKIINFLLHKLYTFSFTQKQTKPKCRKEKLLPCSAGTASFSAPAPSRLFVFDENGARHLPLTPLHTCLTLCLDVILCQQLYVIFLKNGCIIQENGLQGERVSRSNDRFRIISGRGQFPSLPEPCVLCLHTSAEGMLTPRG